LQREPEALHRKRQLRIWRDCVLLRLQLFCEQGPFAAGHVDHYRVCSTTQPKHDRTGSWPAVCEHSRHYGILVQPDCGTAREICL
jgi:hypothetical protein